MKKKEEKSMEYAIKNINYENAQDWKKVSNVINAFFNSNALFSACDLNLFKFLDNQPNCTLSNIAKGLGLSIYSTRVLMLSITNTGLVEKEGDKYCNSSAASSLLVSESPNSLLSWVKYMQLISRESIGYYTQSLKDSTNRGNGFIESQNANSIYERFDEKIEFSSMFNNAMKSLSHNLVKPLIDIPEFKNISNLIDVGGGGGEVAVTLCQNYENLNVTILDKKNTCDMALENAKKHGLSLRIQCRPVDIINSTKWIPEQESSVLMSHFISFFEPDEIRKIYTIAKQYIKNNNKLFIWDTMSNDNETGDMTASRLSMYFLNTATGRGMAYPASEHIDILKSVGYTIDTIYDVDPIEHKLIVASVK
jgi:hypothetical protein